MVAMVINVIFGFNNTNNSSAHADQGINLDTPKIYQKL